MKEIQRVDDFVRDHVEPFARCYVIECSCNFELACRVYGMTPMAARRLIATPGWPAAMDRLVKERIVRKSPDLKLMALEGLQDVLLSHPVEELLALPKPWTREALDAGLSRAAKDAFTKMQWGHEAIRDDSGVEYEVEVLKAYAFAKHRVDAIFKVFEIAGVKGINVMPEADGPEPVKGFSGIKITFVNEEVA